MKLRTGKFKYKIPKIGKAEFCYIAGNNKYSLYDMSLLYIHADDMIRVNPEIRGLPTRFTIINNDSIRFWPTPDKPYVVRLRYTPPMVEI